MFEVGRGAFATTGAKLAFAALLLPALLSSALLALQAGDGFAIAGAVLVLIILTTVAAIAFVELRTGISSSSAGTFYRDVDGWRYWLQIVVMLGAYTLFCVGPHLVKKPEKALPTNVMEPAAAPDQPER